MSKDLQQMPQNEEVDLGQLFNLIGNMFSRFFGFIGAIFKTIFSVIIYSLKAIIINFKIIVISMLIAGVAGFVLEKMSDDVYRSQMLVKPYFDSKFQLVTNICHYNALIDEGGFKDLAIIFEIDSITAKKIVEFEIVPGPETENDVILEYDGFLKQIDSVRAQGISFDDFANNRSIYTGNLFEINAFSTKKDIFKSLEKGLNKTFVNEYSAKKRSKRDSLIALDKARILSSLAHVDSLKRVYVKVLKDESTKEKQGTITLKDGMSLVQERTDTKEFELLEKELELKKELNKIESEKVEENDFFDAVSTFQEVGTKYISLWKRYSIVFPILTFILLVLGYLTFKAIFFIKNYED